MVGSRYRVDGFQHSLQTSFDYLVATSLWAPLIQAPISLPLGRGVATISIEFQKSLIVTLNSIYLRKTVLGRIELENLDEIALRLEVLRSLPLNSTIVGKKDMPVSRRGPRYFR